MCSYGRLAAVLVRGCNDTGDGAVSAKRIAAGCSRHSPPDLHDAAVQSVLKPAEALPVRWACSLDQRVGNAIQYFVFEMRHFIYMNLCYHFYCEEVFHE